MAKQNIVGPLREQSDWEQQNENRLGFIKNKPFYDTRSKTEEYRLRIDPTDLKKEDVILGEVVRISDKTMTPEEFKQMIFHQIIMGKDQGEFPVGEDNVTCDDNGNYSAYGLAMVLNEVSFGNLGTLAPGMYFEFTTNNIEEAQGFEPGQFVFEYIFPSITTGELKTLDEKFLPPPLEVWFLFESLEPEGWARGYKKADFTDENLLLPQEVYEAYKVGRPIHVRLASTTIGERADFFRPPILGLEVLAIGGVCEEFVIKSSMSPFNSDSTSLSVFEIDIYEGE